MSTQKFKTELKPVNPDNANERQKNLLDIPQQKMGMIPNMYKTMANTPALLDTYMHGYDLFRNETSFNSIEQEVVFLAISYQNQCHYCMAAHSFIADNMSKVPEEVTNAIRYGEVVPEPKLKALHDFAALMVQKRGNPTEEDVAKFKEAGYEDQQILEIILAIAVKTISNYSNHIFQTEVDEAFQPRAWTPEVDFANS